MNHGINIGQADLGAGEHNALPIWCYAQRALFCVFRRLCCVSPDGTCTLPMMPGENWQSVALLTSARAISRDGKLIEFRGGALWVVCSADKSGLQS
jgi:hypothetical protein